MKRVAALKIIFTLAAAVLLCSCTKAEPKFDASVSPSDKTIADLSSKRYGDSKLADIADFDGSVGELDDKYPIECVRSYNKNYRVSYLGDGSVAALVFDSHGDKQWGRVHKTRLSKADFGAIKKGEAVADVMALDPDGEFLFLYTGSDDAPRVSSHYTSDGYLISVWYDDSYKVEKVEQELI